MREEVRERVRRLLMAELQGMRPPPPPAGGPRALEAAGGAAHRGGFVTERDVEKRLRSGMSLEFPAGSRFTPLALEALARPTASPGVKSASETSATAETARSRRSHADLPAAGGGDESDRGRGAPGPTPSARGRATPPEPAGPVSGRRGSPASETVAVGADHGGFALKEQLSSHLRQRGYSILDCGTDCPEACDYPVYARRVAEAVKAGSAVAGIAVDGAGIGSAMTANKVSGIRAAHCHNVVEARNAREHNHAHVLTMGAGIIGGNLARAIVDAFLATPFGGGRHARRVGMIEATAPAGEDAREGTAG
ncbi:MAG: ribose 5-phosphate isomerase B [Planctomycetota bacterium]